MTPEPTAPTDGRRARRERSRAAVIDAVFALIQDGKVPPTVEDVAERAGVSVSSVFRNFDGLDDMQRQAFDVFQERFASLLQPAVESTRPQSERVATHVRVRLELYAAAGPMLQVARQRALDYAPLAEGVGRSRSNFADQTRVHFRFEASQLTPADAANLLAVIDSLTSPDAYQVMGAANSRTHRQISRAWTTALNALLAGWPGLTTTDLKENMT